MTIASPVGALEALGDVDRRDDAVDRGLERREPDLGRAGRRASCARRDSCVSALLTLDLRLADLGRASRRRVGQVRPWRSRSWISALFRAVVRVGQLALEVRRVGGRQDLAVLDRVADLDLDVRDRPGRRTPAAGAGRRAGEMGRRAERRGRTSRSSRRCPVAATSSVTSPVVDRAGQVLGGRGRTGRQATERDERGPDADHRQARRWPGS